MFDVQLKSKEEKMIDPLKVNKVYIVSPIKDMPKMVEYARNFVGGRKIRITAKPTDSIKIKDENSPFEELGPLMNSFDSKDPNYFVLINKANQAGRVFANLCKNRTFGEFGKHEGQWSSHQFAANAIVYPNT